MLSFSVAFKNTINKFLKISHIHVFVRVSGALRHQQQLSDYLETFEPLSECLSLLLDSGIRQLQKQQEIRCFIHEMF